MQDMIVADMTGIVAGDLATASAFPKFEPAMVVKAISIYASVKAMFQNLKTADEEKEKLNQVQKEVIDHIEKRNVAILHLIEVLEPLRMDLHAGPVERITATQIQSRVAIGSINGGGATISVFEMMIKIWNFVGQNFPEYSTVSENEILQTSQELLSGTNDIISGDVSSLSSMIDKYFKSEMSKTAVIVAGTGLMFINFIQLLIDWQSVSPFIKKLDFIIRDLQWEVNELNNVERYVKEMEIIHIKEETDRINMEIEEKQNKIRNIERSRSQVNGNQERVSLNLYNNMNNGNNAGL